MGDFDHLPDSREKGRRQALRKAMVDMQTFLSARRVLAHGGFTINEQENTIEFDGRQYWPVRQTSLEEHRRIKAKLDKARREEAQK